MSFQIIRENIVNVTADAIVNTANPEVRIGSGTDTAVYAAAGEEQLLEARRAIGPIAEGDAAVTDAFGLNADIIIHAVSPVWIDGNHQELEKLRSCYRRAFELACEHDCSSIAFPLLAAGSNGFPKGTALETALQEIQSFLLNHDMKVTLVVFDKSAYQLSSNIFSDIRAYIEDHEVIAEERKEYRSEHYHRRRESGFQNIGLVSGLFPKEAAEPADFASVFLPKKEDTFQKKLFEWIDATGRTDPEIYKAADIDRKLFAKIRKDENYKPSRRTAVALALALHLSLADAQDLLERAGLALSQSTKADLIIRYCFEHQIYDLVDVNMILFEFDQELL